MEHRSQTANYIIGLVAALLAVAPAKAADLTYEVRHERTLKDHAGVLTINEKGISYEQVIPEGKRKKNSKKQPKLEKVHFDYQDIQDLWVSSDKLVLTTYKDRKWLLGIDKEFEFFLPKGKSFDAAYTTLKDRLDRRFIAAIADTDTGFLWELPVKLLGTFQGSEGTLQFSAERIVYKTDRPRHSRTWRFEDIENLSTSDPYQLTLTTYERSVTHYGSMKGFNFQLKRPLDPKRYEMLWKRLNREKGLQFLTSLEERNNSPQ